MADVTPKPEKQALKRIEQQQQLEAQEASAKVAQARDVTPGTQPAESSSENEKLKLATVDKAEGDTSEARVTQASEYAVGEKPANSEYANRSFDRNNNPEIYNKNAEKAGRYAELAKKYPEGVRFDAEGSPDFSRYAIKTVKIDVKGNYTSDFTKANEAAGLEEKPEGYTWHHHQDCETMQLVPTDLHNAVGHTGGVSLRRQEQL